MKRQTTFDRFSPFAVSALTLTLLLGFACSSESEPPTEVVIEDTKIEVAATQELEAVESSEVVDAEPVAEDEAVEVVAEEHEEAERMRLRRLRMPTFRRCLRS